MNPDHIAPDDKQCRMPGRVADGNYFCQQYAGHPGIHAAEPSPGETVLWACGTDPVPGERPRQDTAQHTGILGPWGITPDTPEETRQQRDRYVAEESRMDRDRAVEHAINALKPVAGAYDLPNLGHGRAAYGDAIIFLAELLGDYIKNGN